MNRSGPNEPLTFTQFERAVQFALDRMRRDWESDGRDALRFPEKLETVAWLNVLDDEVC